LSDGRQERPEIYTNFPDPDPETGNLDGLIKYLPSRGKLSLYQERKVEAYNNLSPNTG
jgi:hypothetical protein